MGDIFLALIVLFFFLSIILSIYEGIKKFFSWLFPKKKVIRKPISKDQKELTNFMNNKLKIETNIEQKESYIEKKDKKNVFFKLRNFEKLNNESVYENLLSTVREFLKESILLDESSSQPHEDDLIDEIDQIIEETIGNKDRLKDYILIHSPWYDQEMFFRGIIRKSHILYHNGYKKMIDKIVMSKNGQTESESALDFLKENLDLNFDEAIEKKLIIEFDEQIANYDDFLSCEFSSIITNRYERDFNEKFHCHSVIKKIQPSLFRKWKESLIRNEEQDTSNNEEILKNRDMFSMLVIDKPDGYDSYIFIPLEQVLTRENLENNLKLIKISNNKSLEITVGAEFNDKFYPRFNIWMTFDDVHYPPYTVSTQSLKTFLDEEFLDGYYSSEFKAYLE